MIEEEILTLYKKTKKQLAALLNDMTFANFYRALQSGKRSYLLKNTLITKGIDDDWVNAIKDAIPHLDSIVNNPRKYMKRETDVVPVEKARVVDQESVRHLASHTNLINSVTNGVVRPNKILTAYNEESLELYENRFVATLITRVSQFIDRRYFLLGAGGREFCSSVQADGSFEQAGEETTYSLNMSVRQGADYFDGGVSNKVYEDLFLIRKYANSFKYSPFMKIMNTFAQVRPPIIKTNLLTKDPHYRACITLWDFIENYSKAGYKIEVEDSAPRFTTELIDDFDAINMMQYIALKKKMGDFDPRRKAMSSCTKKVLKPTIEEYQATTPEEFGMGVGIGSFIKGNSTKPSEENEAIMKDALLRALRNEAVKRELADQEAEQREEVMKTALKNAMDIKTDREKAKLERAKELEKTIKDAIKDEAERAKQRERDERRQADPAMRALRRTLNRIENSQEATLAAQKQEQRENEQLMKAVLGDLLRIEEERDYLRASPLIIEGGENMPVPTHQQRLPATTVLYDYYKKLFTPPLIVAPVDWDDLKTQLKHKRLKHSDDDVQRALLDALKLEHKRLRKQQQADLRAEQAKQEKRDLDELLEKMQSQADAERLAQMQEEQSKNNTLDQKTKSDKFTPTHSDKFSPTHDALKQPPHNDSTQQINTPTNSTDPEQLGFWQRLIQVVKSWFTK